LDDFSRDFMPEFSVKNKKTRKNKAFERVIILLIILLMKLKIWDTPGTVWTHAKKLKQNCPAQEGAKNIFYE